MNNRVYSDEHVHRLPSNANPVPDLYQNRYLNAKIWLHPLEIRSRQTREMTYEQLMGESERLYQLLLRAKLQVQRKWNKRQRELRPQRT